jgi:hypothetical protein
LFVIPAKAGIQIFHFLRRNLDPGFCRGDGANHCYVGYPLLTRSEPFFL